MDLDKIISEADSLEKSEYEVLKNRYEGKKHKYKDRQIQKMREEFRLFFKEKPVFQISETKTSIKTTHKSFALVLSDDSFSHRGKSFCVHMRLYIPPGNIEFLIFNKFEPSKIMVNENLLKLIRR